MYFLPLVDVNVIDAAVTWRLFCDRNVARRYIDVNPLMGT